MKKSIETIQGDDSILTKDFIREQIEEFEDLLESPIGDCIMNFGGNHETNQK